MKHAINPVHLSHEQAFYEIETLISSAKPNTLVIVHCCYSMFSTLKALPQVRYCHDDEFHPVTLATVPWSANQHNVDIMCEAMSSAENASHAHVFAILTNRAVRLDPVSDRVTDWLVTDFPLKYESANTSLLAWLMVLIVVALLWWSMAV